MVRRDSLAAQVATELREYIADELSPGAQLPSEQELANKVGVSRNTLREALLQLWNDGLLVRRWGVGTFVADATDPVGISSTQITPLRDVMRAAGHEPSLSYVTIDKVRAGADLARALNAEEGSAVWRIDRIFDVDGTPAVYLQDFVPTQINGSAFDPNPLADVNVDIISLLASTVNCRVTRMDAELEAAAAADDIAEKMRLPPGSPVIRAIQASHSSTGAIVIFSEIYYRTDVSRIRFNRTARR